MSRQPRKPYTPTGQSLVSYVIVEEELPHALVVLSTRTQSSTLHSRIQGGIVVLLLACAHNYALATWNHTINLNSKTSIRIPPSLGPDRRLLSRCLLDSVRATIGQSFFRLRAYKSPKASNTLEQLPGIRLLLRSVWLRLSNEDPTR
ncbi:hypothetical protein K458DRAFT_387582 [Lentithecium fluviatile CBS 122367]|uniref:Uncharacterized protein n=1 Tax=Lentithecium fluviatile CBS 122367 TaxID=1168545 RepID=A0A6G1J535_9PLEO|nr:hypothetical protein K458DRAFT_387582 [Lentithecium fluviatile CBS 122367]